jgi:DNA-binding CsgD family transcriptional regulator
VVDTIERGSTGGQPAPIRCGADLVLLAERTYSRLLSVAIGSVAASASASALLAVADARGVRVTLTVALATLVLVCAMAALARTPVVYAWLRRTAVHQAVPALAGACLLVIDGPRGPLWFIAMALLTVTAVVAQTGATLALAVICSVAYGAGTLAPQRSLLPDGDAVYLAAALGFIVNGLLARGIVDWLARFILELRRLHLLHAQGDSGPMRVRVPSSQPDAAIITRRPVQPRPLRLSARQLEVALLLRDGLDQAAVAQALGISARQVERHVAQARERTGSATTAQLIARLVSASVIGATHHNPPC